MADSWEPQAGDDVVFEDELSTGDLVVMRQRPDGKVGICRIRNFEGIDRTVSVFRVRPGMAPDSVVIEPLFRDRRA